MNSHLWTEIISKSNDEFAKGHHLRFVIIQMAIELQIERQYIFQLPLSCLPTNCCLGSRLEKKKKLSGKW